VSKEYLVEVRQRAVPGRCELAVPPQLGELVTDLGESFRRPHDVADVEQSRHLVEFPEQDAAGFALQLSGVDLLLKAPLLLSVGKIAAGLTR